MKFSLDKKVHLHDAVDSLEVPSIQVDLVNNVAHFTVGTNIHPGLPGGSGNTRSFSNQALPDYVKDALVKFIMERLAQL